jgi:hypothetical protein
MHLGINLRKDTGRKEENKKITRKEAKNECD